MGKIVDNRMKNIYKESEGVYRIEISNGFRDDGTRDRIVERHYGDENGAIKRRDQIKALQKQMKDEGLKQQNSGYTLKELSEFYLDDTNYKERSISTIKGYKGLLKNWIIPNLGDIKIRSITELDLEKLYEKMRSSINPSTNKRLSETYVTHCHKLIKSMYNYAKSKKWILSNPADYVIKTPRYDTKERDYYNHEETLLVYELLKNYDIRFKTAVTLLFNTGLRRGELFGLQWKNIIHRKTPKIENGKKVLKESTILKIEKEIVLVNKNFKENNSSNIIDRIGKTYVTCPPKTEKSRRNIHVVNECYDLLMEYKKIQIENGHELDDNSFVFMNLEFSNIWNPNDFTKDWSKFINDNNLKKITVHDIRHSHATYLLSQGIPVQDVSRRLGHSEPTTTLKIYTHSNLTQDQKIVDMISSNIYDDDLVENKSLTSPDIIFSIMLLNSNYCNKDELYDYVEKTLNINIDNSNEYDCISKCRNFIVENNLELKPFIDYLDNISEETKNMLFNNINNIYTENNLITNKTIKMSEYDIGNKII